jgi:hypothetical protein
MKTHYSLFIIALALLSSGVVLARNSESRVMATPLSMQEKNMDQRNLNTTKGLSAPKSALEHIIFQAGLQRGKIRAQQLSKQETLVSLKKTYRESTIGRQAPDQFPLYYKAYKRGYFQFLTQRAAAQTARLNT